MPIDVTAVARVLGIGVRYEDFRSGSILNLPQRIGVIAQGASDSVYDTEKFQATSAAAVGARVGYGSPAHLAVREMLPVNGDGVGTIPIDVYPLQDDGSGVAAAGSITPSGTQTKAAAYRVRVNNILSKAFVVAAAATVSERCKLLYDAVTAVLEMPVKAEYNYGSVTSQAGGDNAGNGTVTVLSAPGQPSPGVYTLECITAVANGGVFRLTGPDGAVISNSVTMTPGSGGATVIAVGGLQFTLTDAGNDFEVEDTFAITVPATSVDLIAKWKGTSGNNLVVSVDGESLGTTWTIVQPTGGLVNPDVQDGLDLVGTVWGTLFLNGMEIEDETALDAYQEFGEGRWGVLAKKPCMVFTGNTHTTVEAATAISSTRRDDRINSQLVSPGSSDLPFVVAARQLARIASMANNNPATGYAALRATGLTPGPDAVQWDYLKRDQAVKAGSSTIEVKDGQVVLGDIVTFYRPEGEEPPAYRDVVDIVKIMNFVFNLDIEFAKQEWAAAPLIPDGQPTNNPNARTPRSAKSRAAMIIDNAALAALISDPKRAKKLLTASINSQNPKRLDLAVKIQISGNTSIIDIDLAFGFFFGIQAAA